MRQDIRADVGTPEPLRAELILSVPLSEIAPGYLVRDRIAPGRAAIAALKASIRRHGQLSPAEIAPLPTAQGEGQPPHRYGLISGWRRMRALSELHAETGEARFGVLRAVLRGREDIAECTVAMVTENEIRSGLSPYERARILSESVARGVFPDRAAALHHLFAEASPRTRSAISAFLELHDALGDCLSFPAHIPERLGRAVATNLRQGGAARYRHRLRASPAGSAKAELALLARLAQDNAVRRSATASAEALRPGLSLASRRRGRRITVTLQGEDVDDALLGEVRKLLRHLGRAG